MVVFGDLPPAGRDLDVLVDDTDLRAVEDALRATGFVGHGHEWVRFRDGTVTAVDLFAASAWQLPDHERDAVFADAEPVGGMPEGVARPSAHHRVLLLARRLHWGGEIDERRGRRLADALDSRRDEVADLARRHAPAWGLVEPLEALLAGATAPAVTEARRRRRPRLPRRNRPVLVALSGVDGSGKTSLVTGLQENFDHLRIPTARVWSRLEWSTLHESRALVAIGTPVKAVLGLARRGRGPAPEPTEGDEPHVWTPTADSPPRSDPAAELRRRSGAVNAAWTAIVAVIQARGQRRTVRAAARQAEVVLSDRYTLDSVVHLRRLYAPNDRLRAAAALLRALSPRPDVAVFLDVPAELARARKQDLFGVDELATHAALYRDECERVGVRRVDADRPPAQLVDEVSREVWLRYKARRASSRA